MTTHPHPNLFQFATSELSQDAFIAWLLSWSKEAYLGDSRCSKLREASGAFLGLLLTGKPTDIGHVDDVWLQWEKIDLYVHGSLNDGSKFSLVVEDKTGTGQHDKQLERYQELAKEEGHGKLFLAYYKTGWWSQDDNMVHESYRQVRRRDILECLIPYRDCHPILEDYVCHLSSIDTDIQEAEDGALIAERVADSFNSHPGLCAFLKVTFSTPNDGDNTWRSHGTGVGGRPWAHWSFDWESVCHSSEEKEGFFWRVDTRGEEAVLSLRKYWNHEGDSERKEIAAHRFQGYLEAIETAFRGIENKLVCLPLSARRSSYKEQELIRFALGDHPGGNDPLELSNAVRKVIHPRFREILQEARRKMTPA